MARKKCEFCGRPATKLCDYRIARVHPPKIKVFVGEVIDHTCDAAMCDECAETDGVIFFSGSDGGIETRDYCPMHNVRRGRVVRADEEGARRIRLDLERRRRLFVEPTPTHDKQKVLFSE